MPISSPAEIANLALWLKADAGVYSDAGSTLATDGQGVQQWNDQSGNGRNLTQATSNNRPTYRATGGPSSLPAIEFDGTNDRLEIPWTGEPKTVFFVANKNSAAGGPRTALGADTSDAVSVGAYYIGWNGGNWQYLRCTTADSGGASDFAKAITSLTDDWTVVFAKHNDTSLTVYRSDLTIPGNRDTDTTSNSLRPISGTPLLGAGYYDNAVVDFYSGELCEVVVYDATLTESETADVLMYLWRRWEFGLTEEPDALFTTFDSGTDLRVFESTDGENWFTRPCFYTPTSTNQVRDPSIIYFGGEYAICHTNVGGTSDACTGFDVCTSPSAVFWTHVKTVDLSSISGLVRCWAPEWTVIADDSLHVTVSVSLDATDFTTYETGPTTADLSSTWSAPSAVGGLPTTGAGIDSKIVYVGSTYFAWLHLSNEVLVYSSSSAFTGYSSHRSGDWMGHGTAIAEGPCPFLLNGTWKFVCDDISGSGLRSAVSTQTAGDWTSGGSTTWSALAALDFNLPYAFTGQHGTVFAFEQEEVTGSPWNYYAQIA